MQFILSFIPGIKKQLLNTEGDLEVKENRYHYGISWGNTMKLTDQIDLCQTIKFKV